ncbi:MAG: HD domain-containing phosphohydrolase [Cellvibrionales bacterium]|jgi:HD-GYP domain-containing protein (c-di-GMP phosphodiesterase class II)
MSIRLIMAGLVIVAVALTAGVITTYQTYLGWKNGRANVAWRFEQIARTTSKGAINLEREGEQITLALAGNPDVSHPPGSAVEHPLVDSMAALLHKGDAIFSVFIGHPNGDYLELSNLEAADGIRAAWDAEPDDRWVVNKVFDSAEGRVDLREYLDADFAVRRIETIATDYRATARPWYGVAEPGSVIRTQPYELAMVAQRALSFVSAAEGGFVVGTIVLLSSLDDRLHNESYPQSYLSVFFDQDGEPIARSQGSELQAPVELLARANSEQETQLREALSQPDQWGRVFELEGETHRYYAFIDEVVEFEDAPRTGYIALSVNQEEVERPLRQALKQNLLGSIAVTAVGILLALGLARRLILPIRRLAAETTKIRERRFDAVEAVATEVKELRRLSASLVSMSADIARHELQQQALHDGIVRLIADAIDQKSPYTAGHCERVPELGIALAEAASDSQAEALADFALTNDEQWREFRLAAWLHDCGKITTPEHIVDKGSKLEAQYNRIHEIRMRFEVLLRDAHIRFLEAVNRAPEERSSLEAALAEQKQQIINDFAFVAECNLGGEFMDEERVRRLEGIAQTTWTRYLDNRIGLSPEEEAHVAGLPVETPSVENLLADKPEHLFRDASMAERYAGMGVTLHPGEYKQNLGEIYNLTIRRGTLTDEDRYIINEHIIATIKMLESLPWPESLQRVPEYAGGHHEKMDGTGYPRSLGEEQLSIPAKILAVADVFEALTAADRPYKKAKPLSVALNIMVTMARERHLDPVLVELLITSGSYRRYAERFLPSAQHDDIDEVALLDKLTA